VYEAFKAYSREPEVAKAGVDSLVAEIHTFAGYYCAMALGKEKDKPLAEAFQDLRELKVNVAYPFLLELYHDYKQGVLGADEFLESVRLIEAYVFRRAACEIGPNSLNKTFSTFSKALKKEKYLESIKAHFLLSPSYRHFPNDEEFKRKIKNRDLYNFRSCSYWLRRLENSGRKERAPTDEYTTEHILPQTISQNDEYSAVWREELGPEWKRIQEIWLHTLGNLTLTGYNSEYSNRPFVEKRDMPGGFKQSPLKLNEGLGTLTKWDEMAIQSRADRLAELAVRVWAMPSVPNDVLSSYRPVKEKTEEYTINNHPHLMKEPLHRIFEAFHKEVLAIDPCVTEEFLKLYVAYKAETNFVDIVPQAKRLRLSLNMHFNEIYDPKGICKDVTGKGRWGNGDVEVGLNSLEELPYVMGLVRQAFEKQMGDDSDAP